MNKRQSRKYIYFILGLILGYSITTFLGSDKVETRFVQAPNEHVSLERSIDLDTFLDVWEIINKDYVYTEEVEDTQDRVDGAIRGMLESLDDPYTLFMDAEETKDFEQSLDGELEGIGAEVAIKNGYVTVVAPLKNTPAWEAGLQPGDIISEVDGESTAKMTLTEAVMKIRGPRDTKVMIRIVRRGEADFLDIEITRRKVHFDSLEWEMKEDGIAYVEISQFDDNTYRHLTAAANEILLSNPKGMIIDLRNNSGGYLDVAVDILSEFTSDKRKAVIIRSKYEEDHKVIYTSGKARLDDLPVVVLINEGSASASEIVAGAVKDWERGTLIGKKTFGKGSVQEIRPLDDGAALRITIAKWNTPNDNNIDKEGIEPDIEIELTGEDYNNDLDPQLDCAMEFFQTGKCEVEEQKMTSWEFDPKS
ncbi:S41 family peptidase [Candidatus Peregrinibacteria bacterium]|jgi:carboxyl-terminal processing protease|nr:S41 family peptidase [Candidatus Peregrinibacteria bacterium]